MLVSFAPKLQFGPGTITHVVWDWNGTLLDDAWLCVEVMSALLQRYGLPPMDLKRYSEVFRFPVRDYYVELGFDFDAAPFEVVGTEFIEGYAAGQHRCRLRERAPQVLSALAGSGISQSVLSASERRRLIEQAGRLGVDSHFQAMIALDDHYAGSKLEVGRLWLEEAGLDPSRVLLVGDTDHDAEVAASLGLGCVLLESGHQSRERLLETGLPVPGCLDELLGAFERVA
ncbi:MAG: HAD family hydrolase [Myxococcota bacterium]